MALTKCVMIILAAVTCLLASFVNGQAFGKDAIPGYPANTPCSQAKPKGQWCVKGNQKSACKPGLTCFVWAQGKGKCYKGNYIENGSRGSRVFQASSGCGGTGASAEPKNTGSGGGGGFAGKAAIPGYPAGASCASALGKGGRCVKNNVKKACKPGLACYVWANGKGKCFDTNWVNSGDNRWKKTFQASTGCSGSAEVKSSNQVDSPDPKDTAAGGKCPRAGTPKLPARGPKASMTVPQKAKKYYKANEIKNGGIQLKYTKIPYGGKFCAKPGSKTITVEGSLLFKKGNKCLPAPLKANNQPCCQLFAWQPNTAGLYYDNCSMKQDIGGNSKFKFSFEMPGDESVVGWGPDNKPHVHYSIQCTGCKNNGAYTGNTYAYWNKFYPAALCKLKKCGKTSAAHQAKHTGGGNYKYDVVIG